MNAVKGQSLKLEDINIGDKVYKSNLDGIYDTYIILINSKLVNNDIYGEIAFIGKELNEQSTEIAFSGQTPCSIYNDKEEFEGNITYDE